jgi:hypothetical protein
VTRIYEQKGYATRLRFSTAVLVLAFLYGCWEIYLGLSTPSDGNNNLIFGPLFALAAIYGFWRLMQDSGNVITALDRTDDGNLVATLWRPWGTAKIRGPGFANWCYYVALKGRNLTQPMIYVDHPQSKRPLAIELKAGMPLDGLRNVAPAAVAEYEETTRPSPPT